MSKFAIEVEDCEFVQYIGGKLYIGMAVSGNIAHSFTMSEAQAFLAQHPEVKGTIVPHEYE